MKYMDGFNIEPRDIIQIATKYRGRSLLRWIRKGTSPERRAWHILVDTDFGGLEHYTVETAEDFVLIERPDRLQTSAPGR